MIASLKQPEFVKLSTWINANLGVKMPPAKITLLESRLQKRLRLLEMNTFEQYLGYLFSDDGLQHELPFMIDLVTTHKTNFFRENEHYDFLLSTGINDLIQKFGINHQIPLKVWSAACSTGEEVYTLAMVFEEFKKKNLNNICPYQILGTDISDGSLETARTAIYHHTRMEGVSMPMRQKYFLRSKSKEDVKYRIIPEIRKRTKYAVLNFMDETYQIREKFDLIFCRNVLIYFDKDTQEKVLLRCCERLKQGGLLFISHTETAHQFQLPIQKIGNSIFQKL